MSIVAFKSSMLTVLVEGVGTFESQQGFIDFFFTDVIAGSKADEIFWFFYFVSFLQV